MPKIMHRNILMYFHDHIRDLNLLVLQEMLYRGPAYLIIYIKITGHRNIMVYFHNHIRDPNIPVLQEILYRGPAYLIIVGQLNYLLYTIHQYQRLLNHHCKFPPNRRYHQIHQYNNYYLSLKIH